jgi:hypothetical protein
MMSDRKNIALYRDSEGSSSLHDAIENRQFNIALNLLQKYPSLALVKDIVSRRKKKNKINRTFFF